MRTFIIDGLKSLKTLEIGDDSFAYCQNLHQITYYGTNEPLISSTSFSYVLPNRCDVFVPTNYQNAAFGPFYITKTLIPTQQSDYSMPPEILYQRPLRRYILQKNALYVQ